MEKVITLLIVATLEYSTNLSERLYQLHKLRSDVWLKPCCKYLLQGIERCKISHPRVKMLILLLFLLTLIYVSLLLSKKVFGDLGEVLFSIVLLYHCLGGEESSPHATEYVYMHEKCFGVIFWFAILGPLGGFLYWLVKEINLLDIKNSNAEIGAESGIDVLHAILAWIPTRITGLLFALVGHFNDGFSTWLHCIRRPYMACSEFLNTCGAAACLKDAEESSAILVHRTFFMWIVLAIIIALQFKR